MIFLPRAFSQKYRHQRGFTLIEMMISVMIVGLLTGGGIAAYNRFNARQQVVASGKELGIALRTAQKRVKAGDKSYASCGTLSGYRVSVTNGGINANTNIVCTQPNTDININSMILSNGVTFTTNASIVFRPLGGGADNAQSITLGNSIYTYEVEVTSDGSITDVGVTEL